MANTRASISTPWRKRIKFVKFTNFIRNLFARRDSYGEYWRKLLRTWNAIKQGVKRRKFSRSKELSSSPDDCCVKLLEIKSGENLLAPSSVGKISLINVWKWLFFVFRAVSLLFCPLEGFFFDSSTAFADEDKTRYFTRIYPCFIEAAGVIQQECLCLLFLSN